MVPKFLDIEWDQGGSDTLADQKYDVDGVEEEYYSRVM